ncbi:MAG TPA: bifunctional DNA-binding transcriptional regulator/O6-methylguanine-DNA methyltransferase Ada [Chloroflexota bacterium]|nr:bifunctional DNA-binding transcriptional regulator/O6-methylguanine-DNA methyltransferase Ada [Chloroflexota bacterium]
MLDPETCWAAVAARDAGSEGTFVYGVVSTGVYCRPSCASRLPKRGNVRFYADPSAAEADGLRPCLRCRPNGTRDPHAEMVRDACAFIDANLDEELTLRSLSARAGLSPAHFQRLFKARIGITPKQYVEAARMKRLKRELRQASSVTDAIYSAGFGSASRVYERVDTRIGMTPHQYRHGGSGTEISYASHETALGLLMLAATDRGICFVQFGDTAEELLRQLRAEYPNAKIVPADEKRSDQMEIWTAALNRHIAEGRPAKDLPLDLRGTAFQMKVWAFLQTIPSGSLCSYAEVATGIGQPAAVRAAANACGSNRVALLIPCHRVIRGDGSLGGYRFGFERKRALIDRERTSLREDRRGC